MSPPTAKSGIQSHRDIVSPPNPHVAVQTRAKNDGPVVEVMKTTIETPTLIALNYVRRFNDELITTIPLFMVRSSLYKSLPTY
jgi:hypothetical protein